MGPHKRHNKISSFRGVLVSRNLDFDLHMDCTIFNALARLGFIGFANIDYLKYIYFAHISNSHVSYGLRDIRRI